MTVFNCTMPDGVHFNKLSTFLGMRSNILLFFQYVQIQFDPPNTKFLPNLTIYVSTIFLCPSLSLLQIRHSCPRLESLNPWDSGWQTTLPLELFERHHKPSLVHSTNTTYVCTLKANHYFRQRLNPCRDMFGDKLGTNYLLLDI